MNPVRETFEKIPFRNKTIAELEATTKDLGGASIDSDNTIRFPNIFGSFESGGMKFKTCLTLIGIEDPRNKNVLKDSCRGISWLKKRKVGEDCTLLEFFILMSTNYCPDYTTDCNDASGPPFLHYCLNGVDRTQIFATEFLCLYRFFIDTLKQAYKDRELKIEENPNREFIHPTVKEVHDLICPFDAVNSLIEKYNATVDEAHAITGYEPFLEADLGRKRRALLGYYREALKALRVHPDIIEAATIELLAMNKSK